MVMMKKTLSIIAVIFVVLLLTGTAAAATTELTVEKYSADGKLLETKTVDYQWMEKNLPIIGDGKTHYYLQGPIFEGELWDPTESINVEGKDMGAVKGTALKDLCDLVGGADVNDKISIIAEDGLKKTWPQKYIYTPEKRMGTVFIAWYSEEDGYVPDYYSGLRLLFTGDTSVNPWGYNVFGVADEKETMDEKDWYYYNNQYPTTTGLSIQGVDTIEIHQGETKSTTSPSFGFILAALGVAGAVLIIRRHE